MGRSSPTTVKVKKADGSLGNLAINTTTNSSRYSRYDASGISLTNKSILNVADLKIDIAAGETKKTTSVFGLTAWGASTVNANKVEINALYRNENDTNDGSDEAYGIQVGTAIEGEDRKVGETTKVTVKDANITLNNSMDSTKKGQKTIFSLVFDGDFQPYQMAGIRVIRNEGNIGSNAIFESTGKLIIDVKDSSISGSGDYILGIYVSGDNNKAILNDSVITIGKSGQYSSALKIGKGRATGTGGGAVESHGNMLLDTTAESTAPTIRLIGTGSKLIANYDTSSSEIKSANTAVLFGTYDYTSRFKSTEQEASFKDAKINTTSTNSSLILVNAGVTGAKMNVKGSESLLTAAESGWLKLKIQINI